MARQRALGWLARWKVGGLPACWSVDGTVVDREEKGPSYLSYPTLASRLQVTFAGEEKRRRLKEARTFANIQRRLHHHLPPAKGRRRTYGRVEKLRRPDGRTDSLKPVRPTAERGSSRTDRLHHLAMHGCSRDSTRVATG
ncbi:hypothetical protein H112_07247 [Trichophyton rubrum D6]|uniref:Uncharacterized protein n=2 Tax=Trichophyton TaxID=5550 RepID=A0A022VTU4_TRIRU|nr:hypothetical protein H100_07273 [Trichophyton rubrum MR850]EZF38606.1 hypothetical protein H102_07233 [Trichophyton rubrum CBS 100081]EZF49133.1 hypothetical protein H103_07256 [Trichophyton rubrum CBS 288.86]EZF59778.1 hypothetical protein H104_07209 [Trichophyton rubrum CBS 289.86]EZF70460.1 hypothetical protein H105_07271 [Trichophyton soudanense CBS 452.61]EZF81152.1 hypothetical protein H110_07254 [Trichophyton rubrum MR1448]EZF91819.1 hypothetical protein H113_07308 [Trichophyton rub